MKTKKSKLNKELHNSYFSPYIVIKLRRTGWVWTCFTNGERKKHIIGPHILKSLKGRGHMEGLGIDRNIILTWVSGNGL